MRYLKQWLWLGLLCASAWVQAQGSLWLVEKNGKQIILAGSIHMLKPEQHAWPEAYDRAFAQAKRVAFEVDMAYAAKPEVGEYLLRPFKLPAGTRLEDTVRPEAWALLQARLAQYGLSGEVFNDYSAAMTAIVLPVMVAQTKGYDDGMDTLLHQRALAQHKPTAALENVFAQRKALLVLKQFDDDFLLRSVIADLDDPDSDIDHMVAAVYAGDVAALTRMMNRYEGPEWALFFDAFLVQRNRAWLPKIEAWLQEEGSPTLVVMGALHLVGPDSVLAMLAAKGYQIRDYP